MVRSSAEATLNVLLQAEGATDQICRTRPYDPQWTWSIPER
jgi:hypothetical protein